MEVELLLDARATLGEGPIWDPVRRSLSWVDQLAGAINRVALDGVPGPSIEFDGRVGAAIPTREGSGFVLATVAGFVLVDEDGNAEVLAELDVDCADWMMNDGKCDALGRFWAGTVGIGADGLAVTGIGALYRLDSSGTATVVRTGVSLSNGMDWSPDGRTFYFIDSRLGGIDAFPFDLSSGELGPPRRVVDIGIEPIVAFADGMCVDADGAIWTAIWGTGEIRRYTPDGVLDRTVQLPVTQPTSCVFAGEDLDVLAITTASLGLSADERRRQPHAGSVFCFRPGVSGHLTHTFAAS